MSLTPHEVLLSRPPIPTPLRDRQLDIPSCRCSRCNGEIYAGEPVYLGAAVLPAGDCMCSDCFRSHILSLLETSPQLLAHALGADVTQAF